MTTVSAAIVAMVVLGAAGLLPTVVLVGLRWITFPLVPLAGAVIAALAATVFVAVGGAFMAWFVSLATLAAAVTAWVWMRWPDRQPWPVRPSSGREVHHRIPPVRGARCPRNCRRLRLVPTGPVHPDRRVRCSSPVAHPSRMVVAFPPTAADHPAGSDAGPGPERLSAAGERVDRRLLEPDREPLDAARSGRHRAVEHLCAGGGRLRPGRGRATGGRPDRRLRRPGLDYRPDGGGGGRRGVARLHRLRHHRAVHDQRVRRSAVVAGRGGGGGLRPPDADRAVRAGGCPGAPAGGRHVQGRRGRHGRCPHRAHRVCGGW